MDEIMVSIILPTYNRAYILETAVESVLKQTYPYFELLIIDDGSTDNTKELVESWKDDRIHYYRLEENGGQAKARNFGIAHARYDYIAFEDSDDIWYQNKLSIQMKAMMLAPFNVGFSYHKIKYNMGDYCIMPAAITDADTKSGNIYAQLLYDNLAPCPSILSRKECLIRVGCFDTSMKSLEDYDLVLKMAKDYEALFIDEILLEATFSENGVSGQSLNYLLASCHLLQKYKNDYIATNTLNHRIEIILRDAGQIGMEEEFIKLMELSLK